MIGHRLMLNPRPRPAADGAAAPGDVGDEEPHARHAIMAAFLSLLLFCVLLAVVSPARACAITALLVLLFAIFACLAAPRGVVVAGAGTRRPAPAVRLVVCRCTCGLTDAAIGALPMFKYESPVVAATDNCGGNGDEQRGGCAAQLLCAVCLEDVRDGETVRQLPPCRHLFHVDCIDLWLRSRRTCPLCRCELSPRKLTAKDAAAAATEPSAHALPLPPV